MNNKRKKVNALLVAYVLFLVMSVLYHLAAFGMDRVARARGTLVETVYTPEDFTLYEIELQENGTYKSTGADPRMILENFTGTVHRVDVYVSLSRLPGEFNFFYRQDPAEGEFSAYQRSWARLEGENHYVMDGPSGTIYGARIDPGIFAGNIMEFEKIVFNAKMPFSSFLQITYTGVFTFVTIPPLALAFFAYFGELWQAIKGKRKAKGQ